MEDMFSSRAARPMLIGAIGRPFDDPDSLFELKLDGERCLAYLDASQTVLVNRRGFRLDGYLPELAGIHRQAAARCILDGELITGTGGKEDFDILRSRLARQDPIKAGLGAKRHPASFVAFDILYQGGRQLTARPLAERKTLLERTMADGERLALARTVDKDGKAFFDLVLRQGLEGVVGKKKQSLYYPGKRSKEWVKVKNLEEDDYVICGYVPAQHVAMLILGQYGPAGKLEYKGRVTLGLRGEDFRRVRQLPKADAQPFETPAPQALRPGEQVVWLKPELVCTVYYVRKLEGGLMRQPHFRRLRPDKAPQEAVAPPAQN